MLENIHELLQPIVAFAKGIAANYSVRKMLKNLQLFISHATTVYFCFIRGIM